MVVAIDVAEDLEFEDDEAAAAADIDAKEDPALGGCGSGLMVVSNVSQAPSPSGLKLRSRSPRPSTRGTRSLRVPVGLFSMSDKTLVPRSAFVARIFVRSPNIMSRLVMILPGIRKEEPAHGCRACAHPRPLLSFWAGAVSP